MGGMFFVITSPWKALFLKVFLEMFYQVYKWNLFLFYNCHISLRLVVMTTMFRFVPHTVDQNNTPGTLARWKLNASDDVGP